MPNNAAHNAALKALAAGLSTVPPRMDGSKRPIGPWEKYQKMKPPPLLIGQWYSSEQTGTGLVTGAVSGNLECLDFDTREGFEKYKAAAKPANLMPLVGRVASGYAEQSPNGYHLLYKCEQIEGSKKLAQRSSDKKTLIETRGEGGYIIVAPSSGKVNKAGNYELKSGGFDSIATITSGERTQLHTLAETFDEMPRPAPERPKGKTGSDRPGDRYNEITTWTQLLGDAGWTAIEDRGEVTNWRRPGKDGGISATTNHGGSDCLWVFSTSTAFEAGRSYTKFGAYAQLHHAGDFKGATRALGDYRASHGGGPYADYSMGEPPDEFQNTKNDRGPTTGGITAMSFKKLAEKKFEKLHWTIYLLLAAGTMLLFGKPKKGKSYLTMMISIAVAAGREVFGKKTTGQEVLYLGLEDSLRRMQRRVIGCADTLSISPSEFQDKLHISVTASTIDTGLMDELLQWMGQHPQTGLIIIDMLKKITANAGGRDLYQEQARVGDALTRFCHDYPSLSIIVVHHSRKAESDDPFDLVSGTTGLSGSYDSLAAIADTEGNRMLHITGRDVEGAVIPLLMNDRGMYSLEAADPDEIQQQSMSSTRRAVFNAVSATQSMTRKQIIDGSGLGAGKVAQQLTKLVRDGLVKHTDHGMYQKTQKRFFDK